MTEFLSLPKIELSLLYADENEFEERFLTLLRLKDDAGIKQIGFIAEEEVIAKWESTKGKTIPEVKKILNSHVRGPLDKLLMASSLLIQYDNIGPFNSLVSNFNGIYQFGGKGGIRDSEKEHLSSSVIWKEVIIRVYTLGALAVFFEKFEAIPILTAKPWPKEYPSEAISLRFWARHAVTMLGRERRLQPLSLCVAANEKVGELKWLFKKFRNDEDLFLNAVCQFDFLQCICGLFKSGFSNYDDVFPSFGIFPNQRTEPIVLDLVLKGKSRSAIPELTDQELANVIISLDKHATERFSNFDRWDRNNWRNNEVNKFLKKNLS